MQLLTGKRFRPSSRALLHFSFTTTSNGVSGAVLLNLSSLQATCDTGGDGAPESNSVQTVELPAKPATAFYRGRQSDGASLQLLSACTGQLSFRMGGLVGMSYLIECSTNPAGPWTVLTRVPLNSATQNLALLVGSTNVFCRAREFIAQQPVLELRSGSPPAAPLLLYGRPGAGYQLLSATALSGAPWQSVSNFTMPGPFRTMNLNIGTNATRFYRLFEP